MLKFVIAYKKKKINVDILKDINTTALQVLSENKQPYPVENMRSPSKYRDDVIMMSQFHNFENSSWKINKTIF